MIRYQWGKFYFSCYNDLVNFIDPMGYSAERIDNTIKEIDEHKKTWWREENKKKDRSSGETTAQARAHAKAEALRAELAGLERGSAHVKKLAKQRGDDAGTWESYKLSRRIRRAEKNRDFSAETQKAIRQLAKEVTISSEMGVNTYGVDAGKVRQETLTLAETFADEIIGIESERFNLATNQTLDGAIKRVKLYWTQPDQYFKLMDDFGYHSEETTADRYFRIRAEGIEVNTLNFLKGVKSSTKFMGQWLRWKARYHAVQLAYKTGTLDERNYQYKNKETIGELLKIRAAIEGIPEQGIENIKQNIGIVFDKEKAFNYFFNPHATLEEATEYSGAAIDTGLTAYGAAKFLQSAVLAGKSGVTSIQQAAVNAAEKTGFKPLAVGGYGASVSGYKDIEKILSYAKDGVKGVGAAAGGSKETGNLRDKIASIKNKTPQQLLDDGWQDITDPRKALNTASRDYYNPKTGMKISFDAGKKGATGFEAVDHYHIYNPNYTNKKVDYYFDINGNPVGKGSKASHITIE